MDVPPALPKLVRVNDRHPPDARSPRSVAQAWGSSSSLWLSRLSSPAALRWISGVGLLAAMTVDVARHAMPTAYVPIVVGLCLLPFVRFRFAAVALSLTLVVTAVFLVARLGVPLRPGQVAVRAAREFPMLGPRPYCFHDPYVQGLFGRTYDCYRHHVVPGTITNAENNNSLTLRASEAGLADITQP